MAKGLRGGRRRSSMEEYLDKVQEVTRQAEEERIEHPTKYNEYGFEVENSDYPDVEFTDSWWKKMKDLKRHGDFEDADLRGRVSDRISDLVMEYGDLEAYDSDLATLVGRMEDSERITDDEYWAGIHAQADMLGMKSRLETLLDNKKINEAVQRAFYKANNMNEPDIYKAIYSYKPLQGLSDKDIDTIYDYLAERLFGKFNA